MSAWPAAMESRGRLVAATAIASPASLDCVEGAEVVVASELLLSSLRSMSLMTTWFAVSLPDMKCSGLSWQYKVL